MKRLTCEQVNYIVRSARNWRSRDFYVSHSRYHIVHPTLAAEVESILGKLENWSLSGAMEAEISEPPIVEITWGSAACHASATSRVRSRRPTDRDSADFPDLRGYGVMTSISGKLSLATRLAHPTSTIPSMDKRSKEADRRRPAQARHHVPVPVKKRYSSTQVACNPCRSKKSAVRFRACV